MRARRARALTLALAVLSLTACGSTSPRRTAPDNPAATPTVAPGAPGTAPGSLAAAPAAPIAPAAAAAPATAVLPAASAADAGASAPAAGISPPIEAARRKVRSAAEWIASGVDSWFGDKPFSEGGAVEDGRLYLSALKRQDESVDLRLRFHARFRLPNVEESTYLFVGRDNPRELVTDRPTGLSSQQRLQSETAADRAFFAGIGRTLTDDVDARLGFRGGLKPYAQVRYRKPWSFGPDDFVEFRQTVFWSVDDHLGSTTAVSYDHDFSPTVTSRWLTAVTITQATRDWEWDSNVALFKSFGRQRLLTLELQAYGTESIGVIVPDYGVLTRWEQPVYQDWLLGEIVVGSFWPRRNPALTRERVWAVGAGVKMRF